MIATVVNSIAIIAGSLIGILLQNSIKEKYKDAIYTGIGIVTLVLGISMAVRTERILWFTLSLIAGGLLGNLLDVEKGILGLGETLKKITQGKGSPENESRTFATGFLDSSVLFCVGAMALVGSFNAGTTGDYSLLLTKSVMDGFISIFMASLMGWGVLFSAFTVFLYQGTLTLLAGWVQPYVTPILQNEISAVGGALVIMIGINLLRLREIKTANFLPSLVFIAAFILLESMLPVF